MQEPVYAETRGKRECPSPKTRGRLGASTLGQHAFKHLPEEPLDMGIYKKKLRPELRRRLGGSLRGRSKCTWTLNKSHFTQGYAEIPSPEPRRRPREPVQSTCMRACHNIPDILYGNLQENAQAQSVDAQFVRIIFFAKEKERIKQSSMHRQVDSKSR